MYRADAVVRQSGTAVRTRRGLRLLRSELRMIFTRRRNVVMLAVLALVPVVIGLSVRASHRPGRGGSLLGAVTENSLFAAFAALLVAGPLLLPLVVSVVAGDSIAGESSAGTLRYLLTVPVARTRLLAVKLSAAVVWCAACVAVVAAAGVLSGMALFSSGRLTLLSGTQVSYGEGLVRLLAACGYVTATIAVVAAIGLFVSTCTEVPLAAMAATLVLVVTSEVLDQVPQLAAIGSWLPTHHWLAWVGLLRDPVDGTDIAVGLAVSAGYVAFFTASAWARFADADITS